MLYAPVIVTTLCRYNHLVRLVESLRRNTGAECTDLYLYIDYPLKDTHVPGYREICSYVETINGFKTVNIIKRKSNYGAKKNSIESKREMFSIYDRCIFSEDDNVFSPNFLPFINKGLEKFQNNPKIFSINGYKHQYNLKFGDNNYFFSNVDFPAWGYGIWRDRWKKLHSELKRMFFIKAWLNHDIRNRVYQNGISKYEDMRHMALGKKDIDSRDGILSVYLAIKDMNIVEPAFSKVRNEGFDGSGIHGHTEEDKKNAHMHMTMKIDDAKDFEYVGDGYNFYEENREIFVQGNAANHKKRWRIERQYDKLKDRFFK